MAGTIIVADNGPGISDDERDDLFSWDGRTTGSDEGGFGLYFVQTMVESYGGTVTVEGNDPRGTVFRLDLPAA